MEGREEVERRRVAAVEEGEMGFEAASDDGFCVGQGRSAAGDVDGRSPSGHGRGGEQKKSDVGFMLTRPSSAAAVVCRKEESGQNAEFGGAVAGLSLSGIWFYEFVATAVSGPGIETHPLVTRCCLLRDQCWRQNPPFFLFFVCK